jgi:hypothetical protein
MPIRLQSVRLRILPILLAFCWGAGAQTFTVSDPRPVDQATRKLEAAYGWAITYEDPPYVHESDVADVTSQVRKDGKSFPRVLVPRGGTFSFAIENALRLEPGTRAPETIARAAILDMLRSYSASVGGVEMFTLTDSFGIFHIIPTQRKDASGKLEKIAPLLDTVVTIPPGKRTGLELLLEVCRSLESQTGYAVSGPAAGNLLQTRTTQIASAPNESARSILSRFFAELAAPRPVSWHMLYAPDMRGYAVNVRVVDTTK